MNFLDAIVLGVIQGLTEFLPVSSSGHLEMGKAILGDVPQEGMLMTIVLHFATALSTIVIFRKDILEIFVGLFKFKNNEETRFSLMIVLSIDYAATNAQEPRQNTSKGANKEQHHNHHKQKINIWH